MSNVVEAADEFATAMQQLSAEAAKALPPGQIAPVPSAPLEQSSAASPDVGTLGGNLPALEAAIAQRIEQLAAKLSPVEQINVMVARFEKIDEQLASIRSTESVNQKLFDSLHAELRAYRDNFLHDSLQKPFIHDLVLLYDHLNSLHEQLRSAADEKGKRSPLCQWRDHLENGIASLVEILHRLEVKEIEPRESVDRSLHRVISFEPADYPEEDGRIIMRVRRGFLWRGKLIRPEEVIAKRFN